MSVPPREKTGQKPLFCIGTVGTDQRRLGGDQRRLRTECSSTGPARMNEGINVGVNEGVDVGKNVSVKNLSGALDGGEGSSVGGCISGGDTGPGPVAPPAVAELVSSNANVTAGGSGVHSSSSGSGGGSLQRHLLEALKRGERSITVEGREVDLSFWIERHGLSAFREERGRETVWSLPTAGPGGARRNVVRLRWEGSDTCPSRSRVVELLLKMNFKAADIYALIHPYGTPEFDISFVRPEGLELFWSNYELAKNEPGWRDFAVQAVSRQNNVKKVTVLTRNESLSCIDTMTWLGRYGEVVEVPKKNRDEYGIWSGAWTFMVKLKRSGNTVTHIPSATFLGRDRIQVFYQGQPKLCYRCGDPTHFSASCTVQRCTRCGEIGHLAASCEEIRCHLCGDLGHPFSRCPRSFVNAVVAPVGESRGVDSAGGAAGRERGPGRKSRQKTTAQLRRLDKRQRDREMRESREAQVTVVTSDPVPETSLTAEALTDSELDEEFVRIQKEEGAVSSLSSHGESTDEDGGGWQAHKRGTKRSKKKGDLRSSPTHQMPKEGTTTPPLIGLSNRFQVLHDMSPSLEGEAGGEVPDVAVTVGLTGGVESSLHGGPMPSGGGTGPESGDEDEEYVNKGKMDTSVSLKRGKPSSDVEGEEGSGKKKAV